MPPRWIEFVKVQIPKSIIDRKDWVRYLTLVNWHAKQLGDIVERVPDAAFTKFVEAQVQNYLKGTAAPTAIQSAVMNIADDFISGRDVVLKAGDYIALQNQFKAGQKK